MKWTSNHTAIVIMLVFIAALALYNQTRPTYDVHYCHYFEPGTRQICGEYKEDGYCAAINYSGECVGWERVSVLKGRTLAKQNFGVEIE